eukprot:TRINITY_DN6337_c0_g4_i1.p1 TRINITY_DN6337_c0_g4~~TRINITY_DN6337_c0_g4_i1.p1  ORF type:complete len:901 (+),score=203.98 TRINITY_DN6337_c0_g4_i1:417-3119(+)
MAPASAEVLVPSKIELGCDATLGFHGLNLSPKQTQQQHHGTRTVRWHCHDSRHRTEMPGSEWIPPAFGRAGTRLRSPPAAPSPGRRRPRTLSELLYDKSILALQLRLAEKTRSQAGLGRQLFAASRLEDGDEECGALLDAGADPLQRDDLGNIPLHVAGSVKSVARLLQSSRMSAQIRNWAGETPAEAIFNRLMATSSDAAVAIGMFFCEFGRVPGGSEAVVSLFDASSSTSKTSLIGRLPSETAQVVRLATLGFCPPTWQDVAEAVASIAAAEGVSESNCPNSVGRLRRVLERLPKGVEAAALRHLLFEAAKSDANQQRILAQVWKAAGTLLWLSWCQGDEMNPPTPTSKYINLMSKTWEYTDMAEMLLDALSSSPCVAQFISSSDLDHMDCSFAFAEHLVALARELKQNFYSFEDKVIDEGGSYEQEARCWLRCGLPFEAISKNVSFDENVHEVKMIGTSGSRRQTRPWLRNDLCLQAEDDADESEDGNPFDWNRLPDWLLHHDLEAAIEDVKMSELCDGDESLSEDLVLAVNAAGAARICATVDEVACAWLHTAQIARRYSNVEEEVYDMLTDVLGNCSTVNFEFDAEKFQIGGSGCSNGETGHDCSNLRDSGGSCASHKTVFSAKILHFQSAKTPHDIWADLLDLWPELQRDGESTSPSAFACNILAMAVELSSALALRKLIEYLKDLDWQRDGVQVAMTRNGFHRDAPLSDWEKAFETLCSQRWERVPGRLSLQSHVSVFLVTLTSQGPIVIELKLFLTMPALAKSKVAALVQKSLLGMTGVRAEHKEAWSLLLRILNSLAEAETKDCAAAFRAAEDEAYELVGEETALATIWGEALFRRLGEAMQQHQEIQLKEWDVEDWQLRVDQREERAKEFLDTFEKSGLLTLKNLLLEAE